MGNPSPANNPHPAPENPRYKVHFVHQGEGYPVLLVHGIAASLHDWDALLPFLAARGYAAYALDLLGHGESGKPATRGYRMAWLFEHFARWVDSLRLEQPPVLVAHSLGGYLALEYARRVPQRVRALVLTNPYYTLRQLPPLLRLVYRHPRPTGFVLHRLPAGLFRLLVDAASLAVGHTGMGVQRLPETVRRQTALDYRRTAPGAYHLLNTSRDLTPVLPHIHTPTLLLWGDRDLTLNPASFPAMLAALPRARGIPLRGEGHVPHQSAPEQYNRLVLDFLQETLA